MYYCALVFAHILSWFMLGGFLAVCRGEAKVHPKWSSAAALGVLSSILHILINYLLKYH